MENCDLDVRIYKKLVVFRRGIGIWIGLGLTMSEIGRATSENPNSQTKPQTLSSPASRTLTPNAKPPNTNPPENTQTPNLFVLFGVIPK